MSHDSLHFPPANNTNNINNSEGTLAWHESLSEFFKPPSCNENGVDGPKSEGLLSSSPLLSSSSILSSTSSFLSSASSSSSSIIHSNQLNSHQQYVQYNNNNESNSSYHHQHYNQQLPSQHDQQRRYPASLDNVQMMPGRNHINNNLTDSGVFVESGKMRNNEGLNMMKVEESWSPDYANQNIGANSQNMFACGTAPTANMAQTLPSDDGRTQQFLYQQKYQPHQPQQYFPHQQPQKHQAQPNQWNQVCPVNDLQKQRSYLQQHSLNHMLPPKDCNKTQLILPQQQPFQQQFQQVHQQQFQQQHQPQYQQPQQQQRQKKSSKPIEMLPDEPLHHLQQSLNPFAEPETFNNFQGIIVAGTNNQMPNVSPMIKPKHESLYDQNYNALSFQPTASEPANFNTFTNPFKKDDVPPNVLQFNNTLNNFPSNVFQPSKLHVSDQSTLASSSHWQNWQTPHPQKYQQTHQTNETLLPHQRSSQQFIQPYEQTTSLLNPLVPQPNQHPIDQPYRHQQLQQHSNQQLQHSNQQLQHPNQQLQHPNQLHQHPNQQLQQHPNQLHQHPNQQLQQHPIQKSHQHPNQQLQQHPIQKSHQHPNQQLHQQLQQHPIQKLHQHPNQLLQQRPHPNQHPALQSAQQNQPTDLPFTQFHPLEHQQQMLNHQVQMLQGPVQFVQETKSNDKRKTRNRTRIRTAESYRVVYKPHQKEILEREYRKKEFIEKEDRERICRETGLDHRQIKIWFQNRRAKERKDRNKSRNMNETCSTFT